MALRSLRYLILCLIFGLTVTTSSAQFNPPCVDSTRVDPFFQCNDPSFLPVCGCDFKTYRNDCVAFRNGGVNNIQYDGVCQTDYFFAALFPNLVSDRINLFVQFYDKGPLTIQVRNSYGNLILSQNHLSVTYQQYGFDAAGFQSGVYFLFVISGNVHYVLKFVKI